MLSTRMIMLQRTLSINSSREALRTSAAAPVVAPIGMSAIWRHQHREPSGARRACSKPRNIREGELAAMDMHAAQLGAAVQGRKHLARVEQALRVERAF